MIGEKFELLHFMRGRDKDIHREGHLPIPHYRQKITLKQRGGDERTILQNRVSQIRKFRDNDPIIQKRPLG